MREDALARILLVEAVEATDRTGELLPLADREQATRTVVRSGTGAAARDARVLRLLGARADLLLGPLSRRYPVFREILERSRIPGWTGPLVLLLAFAAGVGLAALEGTRRINLLAFPFLGVIVWNFAVYLIVAAGALRGLARGQAAVRRAPGWFSRTIGRRLAAAVERTASVHATLGEVVARYVSSWGRIGGPLLAADGRRLLHVGAASLALGMLAGLYLRGIVFRYEAGWESTFLGPRAVRAILGFVYGPASMLSGIALPQTDTAVSALRWTEDGAGGGDAAPWIHLVSVTLALYVIVPRLILAGLAWFEAWRRRRASALPGDLLDYARRVLGAAQAGQAQGAVTVLPYASAVSDEARAPLQRWLEGAFGQGATMNLRPMVPYGEESGLGAALAPGAGTAAEGIVLLMSAAATPESENHGLAVAAARDSARGVRPQCELRVVLDESAMAQRFDAGRMAERRKLWQDFVHGYGVDAEFVDLRTAS